MDQWGTHGLDHTNSWVEARKVEYLGRYLGGFVDGHNTTKRNASLILDNLQQKLSGWKAKMLPQATRTTLIKVVVSAIPLYHMQHTWLTHFEATKNKSEGGMGFRGMLKINEALLAKQVWKILTMDNSLVNKVFMGKYKSSLQNYKFTRKPNSSPLWKKLCKASKVVTDHIGWRGGYWDEAKVAQVYNPAKKAIVLDIVISRTNIEDKRVWLHTNNGEFNVKHVYKAITHNTQIQGNPCYRLNLRVDDVGAQTLTDWINGFMDNWNQGKGDVMRCLKRAYKVVDEIKGMSSLQRQDPFFKLETPARYNRDGGKTTK
ncbi:reverse transcriptase [Senna tora]|uniref:Reverse transcriptase n=1 Tax=Senna tora TaxID=362788 RepID=A0A835CHT4_9FABA|nr:reverse transcriptase [Senna tora]